MLRDLRGGLPGILALTALAGLLALGGYLICDADWVTFGIAHLGHVVVDLLCY